MIFITCNRKLHLIDNFWTFKTQNTEYNYIDVEIIYINNYNSKRLWKYMKTKKSKQKTTAF